MGLDAAELIRLSTLLDEVIDLDAADRETWFAGLIGDRAEFAPMLRRLLAADGAADSFASFGHGPAFTAPGDSPATPTFFEGELIGPYRLEHEIGRGGMGEVWLAERTDGLLKRRVALKLPLTGARRAVLVQRFARERDILASLAHPHIARLYDAGMTDDGQPYLALEYVEGQPITMYCDALKLDLFERVRLLQQVLQAVQYAHANLVIHRDLKPSNVLVTSAGKAMLLDFGIAKLLEDEGHEVAETELTRFGGRAMTLDCAAPEQITGSPVSIATDVWALGILLYELVAGRKPFRSDTRAALEQAILNDEPSRPAPGAFKRSLAADLDTIVLKALKKAPLERYATVNAFDQDLTRWLAGEPVLAQADSAWYRSKKFVGRHKAAAATVGAVMAVIVAASVFSIRQALIAQEQTRIAIMEAKTSAAVQTFLEGIFRSNSGDQADPLRARQRTAKDLLDEGAVRIEKALDDAPRAKLRVLKTLAEMYEDMGQFGDAAKLHERRAALAERVDGADSSALLHALSDLANVLTSAERLPEARSALERAAVVQAKGEHDPESLIAFHLAGGWYGHQTDPAKGLSENTLAMALIRQQASAPRLAYALGQRGTLMQQMNRHREAVPVLRESLELAMREGSLVTSTVSGTQNTLATSLSFLGEKEEAEKAHLAAIESARRYHGASSGIYVIAEIMFSQFLGGTDRLRDSAAAATRALDVLRTWPDSGERRPMILNVAAIAAGDFIELGLLSQATALLDEGEAAYAAQPGNPQFKAMLEVRRAVIALEHGRNGEARLRLDSARKLIDAEKITNRAILYHAAAAGIALAVREHRPDAASAELNRWRSATGRTASPAADDLTALVLSCRVGAAQGDLVKARESCEAALAVLANSKRQSDPLFSEGQISWLLGDILLQTDAASAVPVLQRAVLRMETSLDPERSVAIAGAQTTLARALFATGDRAGARNAAKRAAGIVARHPQLSAYYTEPLQRLQATLEGR